MTRSLKMAGAPITWGVCEVPGWGYQLKSDLVLREIAAAGLSATEVGPRGFLPADPAALRQALQPHNLTIVGGFVPAVLHVEGELSRQLSLVEDSARTLAGVGAGVLVLAAETGKGGYEASAELSDAEWSTLVRGVAEVERIARQRGLSVAVHPHFGTAIETDAQVRRFIQMTTTPLCLDTGHLMVGGANPLDITTLAHGRIGHVHLKDVDARIAARVRSGAIGYRDAVQSGLYRPLGEGDADIAGVVQQLRRDGYAGWYVIEQDLVLESAADAAAPLEAARRSVQFLKRAAGS